MRSVARCLLTPAPDQEEDVLARLAVTVDDPDEWSPSEQPQRGRSQRSRLCRDGASAKVSLASCPRLPRPSSQALPSRARWQASWRTRCCTHSTPSAIEPRCVRRWPAERRPDGGCCPKSQCTHDPPLATATRTSRRSTPPRATGPLLGPWASSSRRRAFAACLRALASPRATQAPRQPPISPPTTLSRTG